MRVLVLILMIISWESSGFELPSKEVCEPVNDYTSEEFDNRSFVKKYTCSSIWIDYTKLVTEPYVSPFGNCILWIMTRNKGTLSGPSFGISHSKPCSNEFSEYTFLHFGDEELTDKQISQTYFVLNEIKNSRIGDVTTINFFYRLFNNDISDFLSLINKCSQGFECMSIYSVVGSEESFGVKVFFGKEAFNITLKIAGNRLKISEIIKDI